MTQQLQKFVVVANRFLIEFDLWWKHHISDMIPWTELVPFSKQHFQHLTHWGRMTHICVGNLTIIGPDNGLSPGRRQPIIWTNAGILLIGPWGTNFSEILIGIQAFSFKKMHLKMSSAKWRLFCRGLNVLTNSIIFWCRFPQNLFLGIWNLDNSASF